jgi:transcriptional regulator with XRE-family HTH domain
MSASFAPRTRLIQLRIDRGLSVRAAAEAMGINNDTLDRMEAGVPVRASSLKAAADFYGVAASELAGAADLREAEPEAV